MKKYILIILSALLLVGGFSCYTQIKLTKISSREWERENKYSKRYHHPCGYCARWRYYYGYPWWLDQYWWWEHYSDENEHQLESRKKRYETRRGLGGVMERLLDDDNSRTAPENNDSTETQEGQENKDDHPKNRPAKRRGMNENNHER